MSRRIAALLLLLGLLCAACAGGTGEKEGRYSV